MSDIRITPMGDVWQASKVFYAYGERGIPDPPPGFRAWAWGYTPVAALGKLLAEIERRTEGMGE